MKKSYLLILSIISIIGFSSCTDETVVKTEQVKVASFNGKWEFVLIPEKISYEQDTVKGVYSSADEAHPVNLENVLLFEYTNKLTGEYDNFKMAGTFTSDSLYLDIYEPKDGKHNPLNEISDMQKIAKVSMKRDEFGAFKGQGSFTDFTDNFYTAEDKITIIARKQADVNPPDGKNSKLPEIDESLKNKLCDYCFDLIGIGLWLETDRTVSVMGGCGLQKNGKGYYIFGSTGPGSIAPFLTQTVYYPYAVDFCNSEKYRFHVRLKKQNWSVTQLAEKLNGSPLLAVLKIPGIEQLSNEMVDFHNKFGGFGFSIGYNIVNKHTALYVNTERGSDSDIQNHKLTKMVYDAVKGLTVNHYIYTGNDISDSWHLTVSAALVCNAPLVFTYLFGTNDVEYD